MKLTKYITIIYIFLCVSRLTAAERTVVDIQNFSQASILDIKGADDKIGFVRLVNLNTNINRWYLLYVTFPGSRVEKIYHLENFKPQKRAFVLDESFPDGLKITDKSGQFKCTLWKDEKTSELELASKQSSSYAKICQDRIFIRNKTKGRETTKEFVADMLRKHVWGGEKITSIVKDYLYKDKFLVTSTDAGEEHASQASQAPIINHAPIDAQLSPESESIALEPKGLGIKLKDTTADKLISGKWYEAKSSKGIFVGATQPGHVSKEILSSYPKRVKSFDKVEEGALTVLVAFDLNRFKVGYSLGTKHPALEWSDRAPEKMRDASMPGPDGLSTFDPVILTGKINPLEAALTVATFTGGFKRTHGAFKWGRLSQINHASHYGFVENGVVFSKLQIDLATFIIYNDGEIELKTWTQEDEASLSKVRHARQNGVPIVEYDLATRSGKPGAFVGNWMLGNWSGSAASRQRALRAGVCWQKSGNKNFLIYGYFSSVTPNAMARVFQAYQCRYAMHLDMNALEHTYLAVYAKEEDNFAIEHLNTGMDVLDKKVKKQKVPRFVGTADNRDFFYIMKRF